MNAKDFLAKLDNLQEETPDEIDLHMIQQASRENDVETVPLDEAKRWIDYSGKLNIRIPRSLHCRLVEEAKEDGVSLNQYILYKLAQ